MARLMAATEAAAEVQALAGFTFRTGAHSGEITTGILGTGPLTFDALGEAIDVAVAVAAAAGNSEVVVTEALADALGAQYMGRPMQSEIDVASFYLRKSRYLESVQARTYTLHYRVGSQNEPSSVGGCGWSASDAARDLSLEVEAYCAFPNPSDHALLSLAALGAASELRPRGK